MFLIEFYFFRCEEDDNEIDIEREFERLLEILKVCLLMELDLSENSTLALSVSL